MLIYAHRQFVSVHSEEYSSNLVQQDRDERLLYRVMRLNTKRKRQFAHNGDTYRQKPFCGLVRMAEGSSVGVWNALPLSFIHLLDHPFRREVLW